MKLGLLKFGNTFAKLYVGHRFKHLISVTTVKKRPKMKCTVAVCQMTSTNQKETNLKVIEDLIKQAKNADAKMVFLPEGCDFIAAHRADAFTLAENMDGPFMSKMKEFASKYDVWLSIGGFHELPSDEDDLKQQPSDSEKKIYTTHVVINNLGNVEAKYRKLHLFDVVIPDKKIDLRESAISFKGDKIVNPIKTPAGSLGLSICYDLRFPELSTMLRKMGAGILTYPSAFTEPTGEAHWETLLRARAIENQCYVVAAAQVGRHNPKRLSYGRAMIVDPWGQVVSECPKYAGSDLPPSVAIGVVNQNAIDNVKRQMPVFEHRRNDVYELLRPVERHGVTENCISGDRMFANKLIPRDTIFYQTEHCFAFTNLRCVVPGHVLVCSLRIVPQLCDLSPEEICDLFQTAVKVKNVMEAIHGTDASTVNVQDGQNAGQTVPHVHCHILPRKKDDFKKSSFYQAVDAHDKDPCFPERPLQDMIDEAQMIRRHIQQLKLS